MTTESQWVPLPAQCPAKAGHSTAARPPARRLSWGPCAPVLPEPPPSGRGPTAGQRPAHSQLPRCLPGPVWPCRAGQQDRARAGACVQWTQRPAEALECGRGVPSPGRSPGPLDSVARSKLSETLAKTSSPGGASTTCRAPRPSSRSRLHASPSLSARWRLRSQARSPHLRGSSLPSPRTPGGPASNRLHERPPLQDPALACSTRSRFAGVCSAPPDSPPLPGTAALSPGADPILPSLLGVPQPAGLH